MEEVDPSPLGLTRLLGLPAWLVRFGALVRFRTRHPVRWLGPVARIAVTARFEHGVRFGCQARLIRFECGARFVWKLSGSVGSPGSRRAARFSWRVRFATCRPGSAVGPVARFVWGVRFGRFVEICVGGVVRLPGSFGEARIARFGSDPVGDFGYRAAQQATGGQGTLPSGKPGSHG